MKSKMSVNKTGANFIPAKADYQQWADALIDKGAFSDDVSSYRELRPLKMLFKLLSEEVRIRILCLLQESELTVSEIQQILNIKQSNLSSHLIHLKENNILQSRREGQHSYYKIIQAKSEFFISLLERVLAAARREPWYEKDRELRDAVITKRRENVLEYFQSSDRKQNDSAPGQVMDVLVIGFLQLWRGKRVIDLGCGTGRIARLYALAGAEVVGVDNSSEQIKKAKHIDRITFTCFKQPDTVRAVSYVCENMEHTSLSAENFDLVVISHALHHAPEPSRVLREAYRLLKPGGQLLIIDLDQHQNESLRVRFGDFWLGFASATFKGWLREIGFTLCSYQVLQHYQCEEAVLPFIAVAEKP
ncbi:hypothetical protein COTS27_00048 [Spirochaetota bacterium]|nr:hypothetical protein COTS27_00048 [Spirochaetota bacterium]